jgi:hypothetical protein
MDVSSSLPEFYHCMQGQNQEKITDTVHSTGDFISLLQTFLEFTNITQDMLKKMHITCLHNMDELTLNLLQTVKMKLLRNEKEKRQSNTRTLEKILNLQNDFYVAYHVTLEFIILKSCLCMFKVEQVVTSSPQYQLCQRCGRNMRCVHISHIKASNQNLEQ